MAIENPATLDRAFQALSNETRRQILARLGRDGSCGAGDFVAQFSSAQPTISKHLRQLEAAGLITREVRGRAHIFALNQVTLNQAEDWLARHREFWSRNLDRLEQVLDAGEAGE